MSGKQFVVVISDSEEICLSIDHIVQASVEDAQLILHMTSGPPISVTGQTRDEMMALLLNRPMLLSGSNLGAVDMNEIPL